MNPNCPKNKLVKAHHVILWIVMGSMFMLSACGYKSPPIPPEEDPPQQEQTQ